MARKIEVEILGDSRSLERAFARSSKAGSSFAAGISRSSVIAGAAIAGFAVAAVKGVRAASDLEEQVNKTNVVFEENAGEIQSWSKTTAEAFGLSRRAALEAAGSFGLMLQTAGVVPKEAATMSRALVELAGDMASFNNIDPSEALDKLRSGLAGETEPLRRLGVFLSEARVQQKAYALGIAETGDELTDAQKVQARYALILEDTAKAQGDFARTSDSLANSSRRVRAQMEDAVAGISSRVLPVVADAVDAFAGFLDDFSTAKTAEAKLDVVVSGVEQIGRDLFDSLRDAVDGIDFRAALNGAREKIYEEIQDLGTVVSQINFREVGRVIGQLLGDAISDVADFLETVDFGEVGRTIVRGIGNFLLGVDWKALAVATIKLLIAALRGSISLLLGIGLELGGAIVDGIGRGLNAAKDFVLREFLEFVNEILGVSSFLGRFDPFKGLRENVRGRLEQMEQDATKSMGGVQRAIDGVKGKNVEVVVTTVIGGERGGAGETARIGGATSATGEQLAQKFAGAVDAITKTYRDAIKEKIAVGRARVEAAKKEFPKLIEAMELDLDKAAVTAGSGDDLAILRKIEARILEQIRIEGETTALARQLFENRRAQAAAIESAKDASANAFQSVLDALQNDAARADRTSGLRDDLRVNAELQNTIRARIKTEGKTNELVAQLLAAEEKGRELRNRVAENRAAAVQRDQFRALGLTGEGEKPTPTIANLRKQLGSLEENVKGTILDTPKTEALFDRVRRVLSGSLGKATEETREKIRELFATLRGELEKGDGGKPITPNVTALDTSKMVAGLGLDAATIRELRGRLAPFNSAGVALAGGTVAPSSGVRSPMQIAGGTFAFDLYIDGEPVAATVIPRVQKKRNRNAATARGVHSGRGGI